MTICRYAVSPKIKFLAKKLIPNLVIKSARYNDLLFISCPNSISFPCVQCFGRQHNERLLSSQYFSYFEMG